MLRHSRPRWRRRTAALFAAVVVATAAAVTTQIVSSSAAPSLAGPATDPVVVVLKDQLPSAPADREHIDDRAAKVRSTQHTVLSRTGNTTPTRLRSFTAVNAFAATLSAAQASALAADPSVAAVIPDRRFGVAPTRDAATAAPARSGAAPAPAPTDACPTDPAKPLLEPEALQLTRTAFPDPASPAAQQIATGQGVTVAYIADGIDPNNPDFIRPDGSHVITDYQDFSGDGTDAPTGGAEAFGDASAIAAQGRTIYDLSTFVNASHPLPVGCTIRILGMAPGARIIALKADGENGFSTSSIVQAIDYAIDKHVDVLNESLGQNALPDETTRDVVELFNRTAIQQGITVTVASGDAGANGTVASPAADANVIAVGATTASRAYQQTGSVGITFANGTWADDNVSAVSSGGITQGGHTIDLVAPGEVGWALCSPTARFGACVGFNGTPQPIQVFGGTSQSAPLVAGAAALVIQAYRTAHHGASPDPALVKQILTSTSHDLGLPAPEQGSGLLDARAAVEAATTIGNTGDPRRGIASTVLVSPGHVDVTAQPGQQTSIGVSVTNVGTEEQTVTTGTRDFAVVSQQRRSLTINAATDPTFPFTTGVPWAFKKTTFTVAAGVDRLAASIAWPGQPTGRSAAPVVRLTLVDPTGRYEANTRPQGGPASANVGTVDVRQPVAGTWTAVLYTIAGTGGFTGPVLLDTITSRFVSAGRPGPSTLRLEPGRSGTVQVPLTASVASGDTAESITIDSSGGHQTSVPVVLRSLVGIVDGRGTFAGTISGGNARPGAPAQTVTYAFDVPAGQRDVGVGVTLGSDPNDSLQGALIDPDGEVVGLNGNSTFDADGNVTGIGRTMQVTVADPAAGRWRFVLAVQNPVSGMEISQRFTGVVTLNQVVASAPGLPTAAATRLPAGKPSAVTVSYRNTGVAPVLLAADARRDGKQDVPLATIGDATVQLPGGVAPIYLVPPGTDRVTLSATSSTRAQVELTAPGLGIDVLGDVRAAADGTSVSTVEVGEQDGRPVAAGLWFSGVQQIGPFTGPAPTGTSTLTATAHTQPFDADVTSSTGDNWLAAVDSAAAQPTPASVQPGQTVRFNVTITPHGAAGDRIQGVLYLTNAGGNEVLAALPYRYTIG